ncbi:MAG: MucR family transcriptional regulator [Minisyncoccia bacterium]
MSNKDAGAGKASMAGRSDETLKLASNIVCAYVSHNPLAISDLPATIRSVHGALGGLVGMEDASRAAGKNPAVPIKKSITPDYLICLEDGKKLKMLKRYLRSRYKLTPEQYRAKWGLPLSYPMVAANYAKVRSEFAKKIGLGRTSPPKAANSTRRKAT